MIIVDTSELTMLAQQLGIADDKLAQEWQKAGQQIGQRGAEFAKSLLLSNGSYITGGLYRSVRMISSTMAGTELTVVYGASEDEPAKWVEYGRGPVSASAGGRLAFTTKDGRYVITKSVKAARPRPFIKPTIPLVRPLALKLLKDAIMRIVKL